MLTFNIIKYPAAKKEPERTANQNIFWKVEPVGEPKKLHPCNEVFVTKSLKTFMATFERGPLMKES